MIDADEISRLLDILGNRNRRRIIQLLRQKPCFVTEISERLMISPKAVIEHLQLMEREHILSSCNDVGRRKYYSLSQDISVEINLHQNKDVFPPQGGSLRLDFNSYMKLLGKLLNSRETLITNLEYLERDIDRIVRRILDHGEKIGLNEQAINLVIAMAGYELTFVELKDYSDMPESELVSLLDSLVGMGVVEQQGEHFRLGGVYAD